MSLEVAGKLLSRHQRTTLGWRGMMVSLAGPVRQLVHRGLGMLEMLTGRNRDAQCGRYKPEFLCLPISPF